MANMLLPDKLGLLEFVNADDSALGLSPFNTEGAAAAADRVMLGRMRELVRAERSFAFETTCAGRGHVGFLRQCQLDCWRVTLIFLWLDDPARAVGRAAQRVAEGGHDIPRDVIVRRYWAGLRNFMGMYLPLADAAQIYDHSDGTGVLVASKVRGAGMVFHDERRWARLKDAVDEGHD